MMLHVNKQIPPKCLHFNKCRKLLKILITLYKQTLNNKLSVTLTRKYVKYNIYKMFIFIRHVYLKIYKNTLRKQNN